MILPKIYPITNRELAESSHIEQTKHLIDAGAEMIQLREKKALSGDFFSDADEATKLARKHGAAIIINDRVDIALAVGAAGVHLGQDDLSPHDARKMLGNDLIIGYSTHSLAQALEAKEMPVDYIAVGPVFPTSTKENPDEVVGLDGVREVRRELADLPLVAIGGITFENFQSVLDAGADSVAMISGLWSSPHALKESFVKLSRRIG